MIGVLNREVVLVLSDLDTKIILYLLEFTTISINAIILNIG